MPGSTTKKQSSARLKFKKMMAEAKKIYKAHPNQKWQACIKEAAAKLKK